MFSEAKKIESTRISSHLEEEEKILDLNNKKISRCESSVTNSSDIAIRVQNLSKCYQIYDKPHDRLKQSLYPRIQLLAGRNPKQYYREFWALKDVSFEVKKGETLGIVGKNGSGKSTLLQIISGTLNPTRGNIQPNGRVATLLELGSGFNPEFTGRENVYLNAAVYGLSQDQITDRLDKIIAFADIGSFIDQPIKTYSSGMYVRLGFAVIANVDADILLIDEALAVGDAYFVQKCMRFLREFTEKGTLIFVSHDSSSVVGLCSNALLLQNGVIQCTGNPKEVTDFYLASLHEDLSEANLTEAGHTKIGRSHGSSINEEFGTGAVKIISVSLTDEAGLSLSSISGGEEARLTIECLPLINVSNPIVGFLVRDRLGQVIFGMNTSHAERGQLDEFLTNRLVKITLRFHMPTLQTGDYSLGVAVAEGTQLSHVQHHWIHDALILPFRPAGNVPGIVGVNLEFVDAS